MKKPKEMRSSSRGNWARVRHAAGPANGQSRGSQGQTLPHPPMLEGTSQLPFPQMPASELPWVPDKLLELLSSPGYFLVTFWPPNISSSERDRTHSTEFEACRTLLCGLQAGGSPNSPGGPSTLPSPPSPPCGGLSLTGVPRLLGVTHFCHSPLLPGCSPDDDFYNPTCRPRSPSSGRSSPVQEEEQETGHCFLPEQWVGE